MNDERYVAQEGGDHYQAEYQHWDWVTDIGMGYLPGNATKYVARWRKKNGLADLKKAMTYIDKMIAIRDNDKARKANKETQFNHPIGNGYKIQKRTERFVEVNKLGDLERSFCDALCYKCDDAMLRVAKDVLARLVQAAGAAQAPAATLPPASPTSPALAAPRGPAGGAMVQAPGTNSATGVHRKGLDGMEHPFGYDDWHEGGPT